MKLRAYFSMFCIDVLGGCILALRFMNPAMTETQLFIAFWDIYALVVAGIVLAWFSLDRMLR